jgi:peptide/nickel transport system substrate-binding protein
VRSKWSLLLAALLIASLALAACQPKVVEKVVEKVVKETVIVAGTPQVVEKVVTEVVKQTVVVEKVVEAPKEGVIPGLKAVPRNRTWIAAGLGGEMVGGFTDVSMFNPFVTGISRGGIHHIGGEGLFVYNMIGGDYYNWQAAGHEYNADFTEAIIKIREGVKWSDGEAFDAEDVAFTLNMLKGKADLLYGMDIEKYCKTIEVVDPLTVKLTFNMPSPRFIWDYLTYRGSLGMVMIPEHVWKDKDPATFTNYDPAKGWPLGTGPYKLVASTVEQKVWDLRDTWWGAETGFQPMPKIERIIVLPSMSEITQAQMLMNNELEMAFSMTPTNMRLVNSQNPKVISFCDQPPYGFIDWWPIFVGFNAEQEPFNDKDIRWAISYSIDRDQIVSLAFNNYSEVTSLPIPNYGGLKKYFDAAADQLETYNTLEYNLAKVDAIMTGKGWAKDGQGFWAKDGKRFSFEIITFPQHPSLTPSIPIVTEQLRRAGFDATFSLPGDFADRIYLGDAKVYMFGIGGAMNDPHATFYRFHTMNYKPTGERASIGFYRWQNAEFDAIIDAMAKLPADDPGVMPLWEDMLDIWLPELPIVPLIQTVIQVPMNTTYWSGWPDCNDPYTAGGYWLRDQLLMWSRLQPTE